MMNMIKGALQRELDLYFQALKGSDVAFRAITKSAFSAARQKIKWTAFIELNNNLIQRWLRAFSIKRWHGLNLYAIDGSTLRLPDNPDVIASFGQMFPDKGPPVTMARISQLFDPLNGLIHDALIGPYCLNERDLLYQHLDSIATGSLLLLDRGFPAFWVFAALNARSIHWCARMPSGWSVVDNFLAAGKEDAVVTLTASNKMIKECKARHIKATLLRVRLIRVLLSSGEVEVLATSLRDHEEYSHFQFKALYNLRWPIEESYKRQKSRIEIDNWTGRSELTIRQDYHAKVFTMNITVMIASFAQETVEIAHHNDMHPKQVNITHALSVMKHAIVKVIICLSPISILRAIIDNISNTIEPVRSNRSNPRKVGTCTRRRKECYKSCA